VRRHPLVGISFLLLGVGLLALGAFARDAPAFLDKAPLPPEVIVPFILWQLATWAILFGFFFLRPRTRRGVEKRRWARLS
jgi:tellurite resistance protein TehA-like permease